VGTQIGGGFILGNTDASFKQGIFGSFYGIGIAFGLLALGLGYGSKLRQYAVGTMSQLLQVRYNSTSLKQLSGILSIASLGGILLCQAIGLKKFLSSMGFDGNLVYIISWGSVILYTTWGGLLAVVWTDLIQAVVMIGMLAVTFFCTIVPNWDLIATTASTPFEAFSLSSLFIPFCFIFIEQDMAQRCFASRSSKDIRRACIASAIVLFVLSVIPTACGLLGKGMNFSLGNGAIFMQVIKQTANPLIFIVAASAVLLAIVSTASSVLIAVASNVAEDVTASNARGRMVTALLGFIALLGPFIGGDIISAMVASYQISVGTLLVPILFAVFSKKTMLPTEAAWGAIVFGSIAMIFSQMDPFVPIIASFAGYITGWLYFVVKNRQNRTLQPIREKSERTS
jgi:SSS family solute:Na+ symporter